MAEPLRTNCDHKKKPLRDSLPCVLYKVLLERNGAFRFTYFTHLGGEFDQVSSDAFPSDPLQFFGFLLPEDTEAFWMRLREAALTRETCRMRQRALMPGGQVRWLFTEAQPTKVSNGETLFSGVTLDITETLRAKEVALKAEKIESLERFAGGIAHDFNNLLQAIMGNISLATMRIDDRAGALERLHKAEQACLQAKELSCSIFAFSRGLAPMKKAMPVAKVIRQTVRKALDGGSVNVEFDLSADLPNIGIDENLFCQVMRNLVLNAREAMSDGGPLTVRARPFTVSGRDNLEVTEGDYVEITVRDGGVGIRPEHLGRVFDPYFTTKHMGSTKGSGLGLSICHSVVTRHNGIITVESEREVGTTFRILLPAVPADQG